VDATGASTAPVPFLQGEGRPEPNSPLEAVWNSLVKSSIMAHRGDGGPLQVEPMMAVPELFLLGERQVTKVVDDELKAPKVNDFAEGEATTHQMFIIGGDCKRR
jgi:hypothetical protein